MEAMTYPSPLVIKIRGSDPWAARCVPGGESASCTMSPEHAAARAAAKHFCCSPDHIKLAYHDGEHGDFLALPDDCAPSEWRTTREIVDEHARQMGYSK
jgi:hypothetical protein